MDTSLLVTDPYFLTMGERIPRIVLSVVIAMLATFVALELAGRVHKAADRVSARLWVVAGSLSLGTGIWSMHFVAMSAPIYPFKAAYDVQTTLASWVIAVLAAAVLLWVAQKQRLGTASLWGYAAVVGIGMCAMHFVGMRALVVTPAVTYYPVWVAAAVLCAIGGSARALATFFQLRKRDGAAQVRGQIVAAGGFGAALAAMQYLAMASIDFDDNTTGLGPDGLDVGLLGGGVAFAAVGFLLLMLMVLALERRAELLASRLSASLRRAETDLRYVTFNDPLTGLPNRLMFHDRLKQAVARSDESGKPLVVLLVQMDDFGGLRQTLDDHERDAVLREAGARLVAASGLPDAVAAAGGHQFLILLDDGAGVEQALGVAERIGASFSRPCSLGSKEVRVSASVGATAFPADGPADKIITNAGTALDASKATGGNCFSFFEPTMDAEAHATAEWLDDLRLAVSHGELELHFQPKVQARTGLIAGVEALLRWRHPARGLVSPVVFIPLAERFGLINELGSWVIGEACRQMREWQDQGIRMRVAINVSVFQLRRPGLAAEITAALRRHHVEPHLLTCEITESAAMADTADTLAVFKTLQAEGIQLSIDDFGTGYSSLGHLRKMPLRQLKIDRSFVMDLGLNADARSVVAAIIDLAHALRLEVVAEGVETEVQKAVLLELGCDKFQGFLFARPMTASAITAMAIEESTRTERFQESTFAV